MTVRRAATAWLGLCLGSSALFTPARAQSPEPPLPYYLQDRGTGMSTSLFGTYVREGELLVYPFYENEKTSNEEYHGSELGFTGNTDYLGELTTHEFDLYLGYGLTDRLALELEGQLYTTANFKKAPEDTSTVPAQIKESGIGEIESQLRYRWTKESERLPEFFNYLEIAYPLQKNDVLIGVQDWEGELGFGAIKGFRWGTLTARMSLAYADGGLDGGEFALEYLKRLSPRWRVVMAFEGEGEDLSFITEAQWFFSRTAFLKLNSGFGLTQKVPDVAPEIGIMMRFGPE